MWNRFSNTYSMLRYHPGVSEGGGSSGRLGRPGAGSIREVVKSLKFHDTLVNAMAGCQRGYTSSAVVESHGMSTKGY